MKFFLGDAVVLAVACKEEETEETDAENDSGMHWDSEGSDER